MDIMKTYIHIFIQVMLLIGGVSYMYAAERRQIDNFGIISGLSDSNVMSITQDSKGHIWVATANGLNRFDGTRFTNFTTNNSGLGSNALNCVTQLPDDPEHLWIGTQRDGIYYYEQSTGKIKRLADHRIISADVTTINPASGKGMWINYYNFGPQYYNPHTGESRDYTFHRFKKLPRLCWVTTEGRGGKLFVGHAGEGFSVIDTLHNKVTTFRHRDDIPSIPGNEVYAVYVDKNGNAWLGTDRGAALYIPESGVFIPFVHDESNPSSIIPGRIRHIAQDKDGNIWFASTLAGVCMLDIESVKTNGYNHAKFIGIPTNGFNSGTSNAYARTIYPDSFGNIWIGNYRTGIDVINHVSSGISRIKYIGQSNGISPFLPTWSCEYSSDGTLWAGGENEIACIRHGVITRIPLPHSSGTSKTFVKALKSDWNGHLWIGTYDHGAMIYNTQTGSFTYVKGINPDVKVFTEDSHGNMFIGTDKGLFIYRPGNTEAEYVEKINSRLQDLVVQSIIIDNRGRYWVGTFGSGVYVFSPSMQSIDHLNKAKGLPSNAISDIIQDSSGKIWIATRAGVTMIKNPSQPFVFINLDNGSANTPQVQSIEEDSFHNIWISTTNGIGRISQNGETTKFYRYSPSMPMHTFMDNASTKDPDGNIYFASSNGIFEIDPAIILAHKESLPATITDFQVYREGNDNISNTLSIPINSSKVNLPYNHNTFTLTVNVLDHALAKNTEFQCKLEGSDNVWITLSSFYNRIIYRNLKPGTYHLFVKQRQEGQDWEKPENILTITIAPPLWFSWWAKTIYVFLIIGIIYYFLRMYRNRVKLRQQVITLEESNRNRQELNEERLRFFTNITHELRTPLTLILGPLEELVSDPKLPPEYSGKLQMIRNSSTQLLNLINGILEFRKTETQNRRLAVKPGNLANLLREIGLSFKELNRNKDVEIILDIENDNRDSLFDPEIITIIVNNIMINAMKYTKKGKIVLSCHVIDKDDSAWYEIKVSDTGYGISKEKLPHIFERYYQVNDIHQASGTGIGLALVKNLVEIHNAEISVDSEPGKGSIFTVRVLRDHLYPEALQGNPENLEVNNKIAVSEDGEDLEHTKVLVVEDNHDLRLYICQCLENEFTVYSAENGLEGLRCAHEEMPDIIVTDIMMPEMDGIAMCRSIKEDILTSHIPVVMLTAKDSINYKQEGYEAGASSYLTKPFTAKLLLARIHNILRLQRNMAEHLRSISLSNVTEISRDINTHAKTDTGESTEKQDSDRNMLSPLDRDFLEKIISVINNNISNPDLGVAFIANKMCMSNSTLYRKVMAVLGVPTNEYVRRIRMQKAMELLKQGTMSITDIAFETGFSTHSSFAKAFKKEYGMSASEYLAKLYKRPDK